MRRRGNCLAAALAVLALTAGWSCGGGEDSISGGLINILVLPPASSVGVGATQQFMASGVYSDGTSKDITSSAKWTSSSTAVATVSSAGLATAVAAGSTTIEAAAAGISGSATLAVTPPVSAGRIAFVSNRDGSRHLYVMASDGTGEKRITSLTGGVDVPDWSPNGGQIVFYSLMDCELFVVNSDGTGERQLTAEEPGDASNTPSWSPDGSMIAFVSDRDDNGGRLWVINADGSGLTRVTAASARAESGPLWSAE